MFDQTNASITVFHLLEHACIELMKQSFIIKGQEGSQLTHHFVYNRMLWSKLQTIVLNIDCARNTKL